MEAVEDRFDFLARELLLWLWYRCEVQGGEIALEGGPTVGVAFDGVLELQSPGGEGRVTVRGDLPTRVPEAGLALQKGRLPTSARLVMAWGDDSITVTLDASTFDLRSLRVLSTEGVSDDGEERARLLLQAASVVDGIYARFLAERLSTDFRTALLPALRDWVATRTAGLATAAATA